MVDSLCSRDRHRHRTGCLAGLHRCAQYTLRTPLDQCLSRRTLMGFDKPSWCHARYHHDTYLSGTSVPCQHGAFSHFFRLFSTFGLMHQNVVTLGGGLCMLFEICEKTPFQKCMGWGGIGDHIFEYRGRSFWRFRVFGPQAAPLTRWGHQLTGFPLGAPTYCGVGAK